MLVCFLTFAACEKSGVEAARENSSDLTGQKILSMDDQKFLIGAERAEIRERTLAVQALQKTRNQEVRNFARDVTAHRSQDLSDLKKLMHDKNMPPRPAFATEVELEARTRFHRLSDGAFDHEFISLMTAEQEDAVRIFTAAAETAADGDIRNYAQQVLPSLQADYDRAADLEKKLAGNARQ
jgi:predicted outer membrane protein